MPDNPGNLSLKDLCLSGLLDVVLAKSHSQAGNIITGHAVEQKVIVKYSIEIQSTKMFLLGNAMGCSENVPVTDEGATTELATVVQKGYNKNKRLIMIPNRNSHWASNLQSTATLPYPLAIR